MIPKDRDEAERMKANFQAAALKRTKDTNDLPCGCVEGSAVWCGEHSPFKGTVEKFVPAEQTTEATLEETSAEATAVVLVECRKHGLHDGSIKEQLIAKAGDEIQKLCRYLAIDEANSENHHRKIEEQQREIERLRSTIERIGEHLTNAPFSPAVDSARLIVKAASQ